MQKKLCILPMKYQNKKNVAKFNKFMQRYAKLGKVEQKSFFATCEVINREK